MTTAGVLIAGATGPIGRSLTGQLRRDGRGIEVIAAATTGEPVARARGRALNLLDPESARSAVQGVERLFLLTPAQAQMEAMTANVVKAATAWSSGRVAEVTDEVPRPISSAPTRWGDLVREHREVWF